MRTTCSGRPSMSKLRSSKARRKGAAFCWPLMATLMRALASLPAVSRTIRAMSYRPLASACGWSRPSSPPAATGALPRLRRLHWFCPAALMSSSYSAKWLSVAWPRMAAGSVTSATTMSAESPGLLMRATGSSASNGSVTAYQSCAVTVAHINKHAAKRMGRRGITNTRSQDQIKNRLIRFGTRLSDLHQDIHVSNGFSRITGYRLFIASRNRSILSTISPYASNPNTVLAASPSSFNLLRLRATP